MKKKTRNMMFGLAAVFVLAVAGVAAYKAISYFSDREIGL